MCSNLIVINGLVRDEGIINGSFGPITLAFGRVKHSFYSSGVQHTSYFWKDESQCLKFISLLSGVFGHQSDDLKDNILKSKKFNYMLHNVCQNHVKCM